jgi:ferrochelatase
MTLRHKGFDAVLVVSFGGPQGLDDIRPFLANVLRGRRVSPERLEEVAHHYELFGGVSPLTAITRAQADGLAQVAAIVAGINAALTMSA